MEFRQAMHVAIRHEFVHHAGERVAGSEFNNLGNAGSAAGLHAAAQSTVCWIWRANLSAPVCTSNTVAPSIPLNSRTSDGIAAGRCALVSACRNSFARIGQQRRVRWYRNRQHRRSLGARALSIMDYSIEGLPCASDQHLVFSVDDRDISSVRLTDWIQRISLETADGHQSRRLCRGFIHRRRALDREIQDVLIIQ